MLLREIVERLGRYDSTLTFVDERGNEQVKTFKDLQADVTTLVARLRAAGLREGMRVGLAAPSSYLWVQWDLALLSLGCVSVAFAQERPTEPLEALIERYALQLMAVEPGWLDGTPVRGAVAIDAEAVTPDAIVNADAIAACPEGTHSLVFSSGTTGTTKGLIISTKGTEHLVTLYGEAFGVAEGERFMTFLPFANYQQRMAYYFCLSNGVDFAYTPYARLFQCLRKFRPTYLIAPPALYTAIQNLALAGAGTGASPQDVQARLRFLLGDNIRYLITGMAPISRRVLDFFWENSIPLYEAFGITEAGMVAWNRPGMVRVGSVGMPAEPGSVSLSDEGEVIISREHLLSLGYFEASADDMRNTFLTPHSVATGDIARFDADGYLTIVGRKKDAIITSAGEKFHPESVESLIQRSADVDAVVVVGGGSMPGVMAVVTLADKTDLEARERVRRQVEAVNANLPVSQKVKQVVFSEQGFSIENGLRTQNMKINRKAVFAQFFPEYAL